jgi:hypothetical protein
MHFRGNEFEPETIGQLTKAFGLAWNYLSNDPNRAFISEDLAREDLALIILDLANAGEHDCKRIASAAIVRMRERYTVARRVG